MKLKYLALLSFILAFTAEAPSCGINLVSHMDAPAQKRALIRYGEEGSSLSLLVIKDAEGKYGYCDNTGKVVIQPQYNDASPFFEGLAAVKKGDRCGYIDSSGTTALPFRYYDARDFHDSKAFVSVYKTSSVETEYLAYCLIDKKGEAKERTNYTSVMYSGGMYSVKSLGSGFLLDTAGNVVFQKPPSEADIGAFFNGVAPVKLADNTCIYVDKIGKQAFEGEFQAALAFSNGLAAVMPKNAGNLSWGYIDTFGRTAIAPKYDTACDFGEGLAAVQKNDGWFFIDASGDKVLDILCPVDKVAGSFSESLCAIAVLSSEPAYHFSWGFIDRSGKLVIDCKYDQVTPFKNGIAEVLLNGKIGYIDKTGKYIWEPK